MSKVRNSVWERQAEKTEFTLICFSSSSGKGAAISCSREHTHAAIANAFPRHFNSVEEEVAISDSRSQVPLGTIWFTSSTNERKNGSMSLGSGAHLVG